MNNQFVNNLPTANDDAEAPSQELQNQKSELKSDINRVLHYLLPWQNRRASERRHSFGQPFTNRRCKIERRLPPQRRLKALRRELVTLLQSEPGQQEQQSGLS